MNPKSNQQFSPYESTNMQDQCRQYMFHDVIVTMKDGSAVDGIIEDVSSDRVRMLVGENIMEGTEGNGEESRQYGGYGYGRPRRRYRRFRRREFPLGALATLALLPYIAPQPYPYYPYPYY